MNPIDRLDPLLILPVPAFQTNYLWLLCRNQHAVVVDPGDAQPIEAALQKHALDLSAIVLTHHHQDHIGGVADLIRNRTGLPVYGPRNEVIAHVTHPLGQGDRIKLQEIDLELNVIDVPGHTLGHIAYFGYADGQPVLFCGDTLFSGGCGRLLGGTAKQLLSSLTKIAALPDATRVYCAHEYTLSNLEFALTVDPDNSHLQSRMADVLALRKAGQATVPSTLTIEKQTNPFLRADYPNLQASAERIKPGSGQNVLDTFTTLRSMKDNF